MTILQPKFLPEEFCSKGTEATDFTYPPIASADKTQPTLDNGFVYLQQVKPIDGGAVVKRQQFNGILKWMSGILSFLNKGGFFTYNASNTTGYQLGAILFDHESKTFQISLKDNNTADFVLNRNYLNDGENWAWMNPTAREGQLMYSMQKENYIEGCGEWLIANGQAIPAKYTKSIARWGANVPDLQDRVLAMCSSTNPLGKIDGDDTKLVPLPKHNHQITQTSHTHYQRNNRGTSGTTDHECYNNRNPSYDPDYPYGMAGSANITINYEGSEDAKINVKQKTYYLYLFIYVQ